MENHGSCDVCLRAWAAGLFDAEGSASVHGRRRAQPELFVYQAGRSEPPEVLVRFRSTLECGSIVGPYRERLWCWRAGSARDIAGVATSLWPWLGQPKRSQLLEMARVVPALAFLGVVADVWDRIDAQCREGSTVRSAVAWAGGFFVGEGWVGCKGATPTRPWPQLQASVTQAGLETAPAMLERFRSAVSGLGSIGGPYMPSNAWSRQPQFRWSIGSEGGTRRVLELLWPWLDARKREQARVAITRFEEGRTRKRASSR